MGPGLLPDTAPQAGDDITSTQDGRTTLPIMICAAALLLFGVVKSGFSLAQQDFRFTSVGLAVLGTVAVCFVLFWNSHSLLKAQVQRLTAERARANQRQAEAAAAAQENARLLATMSHEIRTPLNGVIGMLALLLETELTAEQKNYAGIAHASGRTLLSILDELLDRAKSEALHSDQPARVELGPLVENVTELLAPRAHAKDIEISSYIAPDVPSHVPLRDLHVRQVLFNLAGNAIKFTQTGGVEIAVTRASATQIQIVIRDSGIGMTADELAHVFDAFAQANETTARRFGGTGLGLTISRQLVEAMKGSLTVDSAPQRGTTFTLLLPAGSEAAAAPAPLLAGRHYVLSLQEGFAAAHMRQSLVDLGAVAEVLPVEPTALAAALDALPPGTAVVCDKSTAEVAARRLRKAGKGIRLWILIHPEERRGLRHLLSAAHTGYLVKPVRRATLISQLTAADDAQLALAASDLRQMARKTGPATRALRLLLVDDTPVNALLAKTMLGKEGHDTVCAASGAEALALLASDRAFDAVLMDVEMPGMDGHAAARAIRAQEEAAALPRLPIVAMTAHAREQDVRDCLASGMDGHVAKPFDRQDLHDALARLARPRAA